MQQLVFKCKCMTGEASTYVRQRLEGEDVVSYMENAVKPALAVAHRMYMNVSGMWCESQTMEYVKMPFKEGDKALFLSKAPDLELKPGGKE